MRTRRETLQAASVTAGSGIARAALRCAAAGLALGAGLGASALASPGEMRKAGECYARNDTKAALGILNRIIRRKGKTVWMSEALFLRAKIREKDLGDRRAALRDLRLLTVHFPGTTAAAFGQFRIARLYEKAGAFADAYREYVLCSRLRGISAGPEGYRYEFPGLRGIPEARMNPEAARRLVEIAAERAVRLFARVPLSEFAGRKKPFLPPRTFVVAESGQLLKFPADPGGRTASGERADVWYIVASKGKWIRGASVELLAAVDYAAAGLQRKKRYSVVVEPLPRGSSDRMLALYGEKRRPEKLTGKLRLERGVAALKISFYRQGARISKCSVRVALDDRPPAPRRDVRPPAGLRLAVPPAETGAGGVALVRAPGRAFLLAYHSPGPAAGEPDEDADLFLTRSRDGKTWSRPERIPVSSAVGDSDPTMAVLPDGRTMLAWTSERRGAGTSDVYMSTSRDAKKWSKPVRLGINPQHLKGMEAGGSPKGGHVTFHKPVISVDSAGRIRLFFVAHAFRREHAGGGIVLYLAGTGLFGVVSTDGLRWSKPGAIISTPQTPLDRYRPVPRGDGRLETGAEAVAADRRPSVIERSPGRSLIAWVSTYGRVFLTQRDARKKWVHADPRFSGADAATVAEGVCLLGPRRGGGYGVLVVRRDIGPRMFWRGRKERTGWKALPVVKQLPRFGLGEVAVLSLGAGRGWLAAFTASHALGPTGVYLKEIAAPGKK